jgi:hypothetical protein
LYTVEPVIPPPEVKPVICISSVTSHSTNFLTNCGLLRNRVFLIGSFYWTAE